MDYFVGCKSNNHKVLSCIVVCALVPCCIIGTYCYSTVPQLFYKATLLMPKGVDVSSIV